MAALLLRNRLLGTDDGDDRQETLPLHRIGFPRHAAPAIASLLAKLPHQDILATTIDLPLQTALERLVSQQLQPLPPRVSIAALVVDAQSREIRAIVSGDGSAARAGALDLTLAWRSPGSALKPFLYGLAFQDGIVRPDTTIDDLPRHFGSYAPENFDRSFAGPSARPRRCSVR